MKGYEIEIPGDVFDSIMSALPPEDRISEENVDGLMFLTLNKRIVLLIAKGRDFRE